MTGPPIASNRPLTVGGLRWVLSREELDDDARVEVRPAGAHSSGGGFEENDAEDLHVTLGEPTFDDGAALVVGGELVPDAR